MCWTHRARDVVYRCYPRYQSPRKTAPVDQWQSMPLATWASGWADRRNVFSMVETKLKNTGYGNLVQRCIGIYFFLVDMNGIHWDGRFVEKKNGIISTSPKNGKTVIISEPEKKKKNVDLGAQGTVNRQWYLRWLPRVSFDGFFESELNRWIRRPPVASKKKPLLCGRDQPKSKGGSCCWIREWSHFLVWGPRIVKSN